MSSRPMQTVQILTPQHWQIGLNAIHSVWEDCQPFQGRLCSRRGGAVQHACRHSIQAPAWVFCAEHVPPLHR